MKKTLIAAWLLVLTTGLFAQENFQGFALTAGMSANPLRERSNISDKSMSSVTRLYGIKIGGVYEATIVKGLGLQMGLNYTFGTQQGKWAFINNSASKLKQKDDYYYHQIEIPVDWQYKFLIAKNTHLLIYTGPTLQVGLSLNEKNSREKINGATFQKEIITTTSKLYSKEYDTDQDGIYEYNRLNVTWGVGAGFQYKDYYIRGGYDFGIYNPYHDRQFDGTETTTFTRKGRFDQWSIKLGIFIWRNDQ